MSKGEVYMGGELLCFWCHGGAQRPRGPRTSIACIPFRTRSVILSAHYPGVSASNRSAIEATSSS